MAGVLHAGAAQQRELRRAALPRPALPHQHRLRPHLRQSGWVKLLTTFRLIRMSYKTSFSSTGTHLGCRAGRGAALAAAGGSMWDHCPASTSTGELQSLVSGIDLGCDLRVERGAAVAAAADGMPEHRLLRLLLSRILTGIDLGCELEEGRQWPLPPAPCGIIAGTRAFSLKHPVSVLTKTFRFFSGMLDSSRWD